MLSIGSSETDAICNSNNQVITLCFRESYDIGQATQNVGAVKQVR